jgi:hypothetical protein
LNVLPHFHRFPASSGFSPVPVKSTKGGSVPPALWTECRQAHHRSCLLLIHTSPRWGKVGAPRPSRPTDLRPPLPLITAHRSRGTFSLRPPASAKASAGKPSSFFPLTAASHSHLTPLGKSGRTEAVTPYRLPSSSLRQGSG